MSATPEYYFKRRWNGMENLARVVGTRDYSNKRSSLDQSIGEQLQDLSQLVENILASSSDIRNALIDESLSEDALYQEVAFLDDRVNHAISVLKDGINEIHQMCREMPIPVVNHKVLETLLRRDEFKRLIE